MYRSVTFKAHRWAAWLSRGGVFVAALGCLLLAACSQGAVPAATTALTSPICPTCATCPTAISSPTPGPTPAPPPWPTPTGDEDILPAPLYYVSTQQEENSRYCPLPHIVRIERDGRTRTVIGSCFISGGINGFDVSPVDGSLVIAAEGSLWVTDANGENARRLVQGLPDPEDSKWFGVRDPTWSPNGTQVAYADGGIRILDVASGARIDIVEDNCSETSLGEGSSCCLYGEWFFEPEWSPDGQALLFTRQTADYSQPQVIVLPSSEEPTAVPGLFGRRGGIAWSRDGMALLFDYWWPATYRSDLTEPSLVRMSREDFGMQVLWPHSECDSWQVRYPFEAPDGRILFFQAEPCSTGPCHNYALVEGRLTDEGFDMHILRHDARPEGTRDVVWYDSGEFLAFLTSSDHWYVAVMEVATGQILLLAEEDAYPGRILWGSP
jgi:Tol biopolymer transport system component